MDCGKESCVEEVLTDGLHVEVHEGGGEAGPPEQRWGLLLPLYLQPPQGGQ